MRRLAFTICSNNFLSQATTLADSLLAKNPDYEVVIGLADKRSEAIDYSRFRPCRIVSIDELNIPNLPWMISNYNIVELNTAVKPYFFEFLFGQHDVSHILYFDPDIQVYDALDALTDHFQNHDILLTPHVILPIPKDVYPWENHFLKHGVYNLGFIGLKNTANVHSLLNWWQARTAEHCLADFRKGL